MSKRSSILKPQRTRNAFEDVNMDSPEPKEGDTGRFSRKVRFSSNFVKTFVTEDEGKDTIWDKTYEEVIEDSAQSTSIETMHVIKEKEKIVDKEQSLFVEQDNKENELNFSVNTSLFEKENEKFTVFNDEDNCNNHNKSLFDLSIKSKIGLSNITETSLDSTSKVKMEIQNALKVDDYEMTDNYTKAYELSNYILFEEQQHKFSENTRDDFEITASLPLQFSEEASQLETSQNEIEFTVNHSMCLNGKELEFTELMLDEPKKALENSTNFPEENIGLEFTEQLNKTDPIMENIVHEDDALNDSKMRVCETTGDTRNFLQDDMKFSFQVNDKTMEVNAHAISENNDLVLTDYTIHKDCFGDLQKTMDCIKSDAVMKFTTQGAQTAEKDAILFSAKNNDLEMTKEIISKSSSENNDLDITDEIGNKIIDERSSRKTMHFPKSNDEMEFTMQMPQFNGKDLRKTILFSSKNNDLEITEEIGNKLIEETDSRKTKHFQKSEDDMEFTMQMPQVNTKDLRKTILFSSENNDLEITEQIENNLVEERDSRKTMHFPKSEDDMELTLQMPQYNEKDLRNTILFSSENNDMEMTEQIGNKLGARGSRNTMHFQKLEDDMEFTMQMPQFNEKDIRKTIMFSSENNDLEITEQVGNTLIDERGSRKTMHFQKSEDEMEFTMEIPQVNDNDLRKTELFSSENNDLEITEQIGNTLLDQRGSTKTMHLKKSEDDMEFTMQMPQFNGKDLRKTLLFSSENNDSEIAKQIGNKLLEDKGLQLNENNSRKTILFSSDNNDLESRKTADISKSDDVDVQFTKTSESSSRKSIPFSVENNILEIEDAVVTSNVVNEGQSNENRNFNVEVPEKIKNFQKVDGDMEFTQQLPYFGEKIVDRENAKTILFSENNDLEMTEKIDRQQDITDRKNSIDVGRQFSDKNEVEKESRKTIYFPKTSNDMEFTMEMPSFIKKNMESKECTRKTILFSSDNNDMGLTEMTDFNLFKNVIGEKSDFDVPKSDDGNVLEFGKQMNRKTILFSDENNDMEVTKSSTLAAEEIVKNQCALPIKESIEKGTPVEQRKTKLSSSENDDFQDMERKSKNSENYEKNSIHNPADLYEEKLINSTSLPKPNNNYSSQNDMEDLNSEKENVGNSRAMFRKTERTTILFGSENDDMEVTQAFDLNLVKDQIKVILKSGDIAKYNTSKPIDEVLDANTPRIEEKLKKPNPLLKSKNDVEILTKKKLDNNLLKTGSKIILFSSENNDMEITEKIDLSTFVGKSKIPKFSNVDHTTSKVINQMFNSKTTHVADKPTELGTDFETKKENVTGIKLNEKTMSYDSSDTMEVNETVDLKLTEERVKLSKSGSDNKSALPEAVSHVTEEKSIMLEESMISNVNDECCNKLKESLDARRTKDKLNCKSKETKADGLKMLVDRSNENIRSGEELKDGKMEMESSNCNFNNLQGSSYVNVDEDKMQCEDDTYIEISSTCLQDIEKDVSSCNSSMRKRTLESVHKSNKKFMKESNHSSNSSFTEMLSEISFSESCGDFSRTANVTPRESLRNFDATVNFTLKLDQTTIVQEPYDLPKAQYTNYDLGEILRCIGPVHTETKDLKKSNRIIEEFRNEMSKYEALLAHIRCDLEAQQEEDVNPTDKPFFVTTTVAKTIREEVEEKQKLCNGSFSAKFPKERTCEVRALFGTILIRMEFDEVSGLVQQTEVVKKLSPKVVTPIIRYVHRLLLDKINDVKTSLGNSFSILTLLDYIHLHQGEILRQRQEFEDMCKIYYKKRRHDIEMDENFIVNWHIVEVRLGFSCIVKMNPSKLSAEHIVIESEIGYFNNSEILELLTGCANNLTGIRKFVDRVSRMLVVRGEEEFTTYMAQYNHLFN